MDPISCGINRNQVWPRRSAGIHGRLHVGEIAGVNSWAAQRKPHPILAVAAFFWGRVVGSLLWAQCLVSFASDTKLLCSKLLYHAVYNIARHQNRISKKCIYIFIYQVFIWHALAILVLFVVYIWWVYNFVELILPCHLRTLLLLGWITGTRAFNRVDNMIKKLGTAYIPCNVLHTYTRKIKQR